MKLQYILNCSGEIIYSQCWINSDSIKSMTWKIVSWITWRDPCPEEPLHHLHFPSPRRPHFRRTPDARLHPSPPPTARRGDSAPLHTCEPPALFLYMYTEKMKRNSAFRQCFSNSARQMWGKYNWCFAIETLELYCISLLLTKVEICLWLTST